jgi:hypothetical protein
MVVLEMLQERLSDDAVDRISTRIGADADITGSAINSALPLLLTAMADNLNDEEHLQALAAAVAEDHDGSILDDVSSYVDRDERGSGRGILRHVLGGRLLRVERGLSQVTGLAASKAGQLLTLLAPLLMGALGRAKRERGLNQRGLATVLTIEHEQLEQSAPGVMGRLRWILGQPQDGSIMENVRGMLGKTFGSKP